MSKEKAGGFISKICFNDGKCINIEKGDIVIFVGPNNAGKSQALKDIYSLSKRKRPSVVVSDITITKYKSSILPLLNEVSVGNNQGDYITYSVLGNVMNFFYRRTDQNFPTSPLFEDFRELFVANLDTSARLTICNPPNNIRADEVKKHPIHYAAFMPDCRKWLSDNFKKAFGIEITPNKQNGATIPLCIGEPVRFDEEFEDEQARQEAYAAILETYKQVQNQGDGIKSFTGILLYLMLNYYCIYLIDEPESFLHPPQARIMGQIIGQTLSDSQQAFISTHSEDIIKGLLEVCPHRIKIVRITRQEDINSFSVLDNEKLSDVWNDSLLKHSNIMSSLFHKSVVLCESDSDCKIYSIIENHLKREKGKYSETLFIHCGGKHRMAKIVKALRVLNIDVKLITDIDVLNDDKVLRAIIEVFNIEWSSVEKFYRVIVSNLHSSKEKINRNDARMFINNVLDSSEKTELTGEEIKEIRSAISLVSKWEGLKSSGTAALPAGDATSAFKNLDNILKNAGIYIVPVGELECFIKEVGGHGPEWANQVLEKFPDLNDNVYIKIKQFVECLNL